MEEALKVAERLQERMERNKELYLEEKKEYCNRRKTRN